MLPLHAQPDLRGVEQSSCFGDFGGPKDQERDNRRRRLPQQVKLSLATCRVVTLGVRVSAYLNWITSVALEEISTIWVTCCLSRR